MLAFMSPGDEQAFWDDLESDRGIHQDAARRVAAQPDWHAALAKRLSEWADAAPTLSPGLVWAASHAGWSPDSKIGRFLISDIAPVMAAVERGQPLQDAFASHYGLDLHPDPSGVRGVFHDVGRALTTGVRYAGAAAEDALGAVQTAGSRLIGGGLEATAMISNDAPHAPPTVERQMVQRTPIGYMPPSELPNANQLLVAQMLRGEDAGTGFRASGPAREEAVAAQRRQRGTVDGHAATVGRLLAATVVEPDTTPFRVMSGLTDMAVATFADPTSLALAGVGDIAQARRLFAQTGMYENRFGQFLHGPTAAGWLDSRSGGRVLTTLAGEGDTQTVWHLLKEKVPVGAAARIADASTPAEVRQVLEPLLGLQVREVPSLSRTYKVTRELPLQRWGHQLPAHTVDVGNMDDAVRQIERVLYATKVPRDEAATIIDRAARVTDRNDLFTVVTDFLPDAIERRLTSGKFAVSEGAAKRATRVFLQDWEDQRKFWIDAAGAGRTVEGPVIGGELLYTGEGPYSMVDMIQRKIPLPDVKAIADLNLHWRFYAAALGGQKTGLADASRTLADFINGKIFKVGALARIAWPVRVIAEEQIRMGAADLDSMFHHPLSYIADLVGRGEIDPTTMQTFEEAAQDAGGMFAEAMSRGGGKHAPEMAGRGRVYAAGFTTYKRDAPTFSQAWANHLTHLRMDPVAREVARATWDPTHVVAGVDEASGLTGLDAVKQWVWDQPDRRYLKAAAQSPSVDSRIVTERAWADKWVDGWAARIHEATGGDPELIERMAKGRWGKYDKRTGRWVMDDKTIARLDALKAEGVGPERVVGRIHVKGQGTTLYDRAVDRMFYQLMSRPTNYLSRSPAFRQYYWQRIGEMFGQFDVAAQARLIAAADKAPLSGALRRKLVKASGQTGEMPLRVGDDIAKAHALDQTKRLLYDAAERGQFFNATRLIFPFGEAWKEVIGRWVMLTKQNPAVIRRAQQGLQGAADTGVFVTDPDTGQMMFTFPGSAWLSKKVGAPFPLMGRVQGLNIIGQGLPGIGPVVQIPASKLIPYGQKWDFMREQISPFGDPETESGVLEAFFPGWIQKMRAAGWLEPFGFGPTKTQERTFENFVKDIFAYHASTGAYDTSTDAGLNQLLNKSRNDAKKMMFWRGLAQSFSPTAPTFDVKLMAGSQLLDLRAITADYARMLDADYTTATQKFIERYGIDARFVLEGKGYRTVRGVPVTHAAAVWADKHKDFVGAYPAAYGFFAPQGGEFDFDAYNRAIDRGDIVPLSAEDWVRLGNARVADSIYRHLSAKVGPSPTDEQVKWLRDTKLKLRDQFPGYEEQSVRPGRADREEIIRQFAHAVDSPAVAKTVTAETIRGYMKLRATAISAAWDRYGTTLAAQAAEPLRAGLREMAAKIIRVHPEFAPAWEQVFSAEVDVIPEEG